MFLGSVQQTVKMKKQLNVTQGKGGLPLIEIDNDFAKASISIHGGQVLSYIPKVGNENSANTSVNKDLLFVSEDAYFEAGKAIRGGIPICWPWFGQNRDKPESVFHGFVRNALWTLDETALTDEGETKVVLSISESDETFAHWPHKFKLTLTVIVGKSLKISLHTQNNDTSRFKITQALHTYFALDDINKVRVEGLDNVEYVDTLVDLKNTVLQKGEIRVAEEVDRIYINTPSQLSIFDEKSEREIAISSSGSDTAVVWNPWIDKSKRMADLNNDAYLGFICVETANAAENYIFIEPNESHTISAEYTVK